MDVDLISSYAGLLSLATSSIYAGSIGSIPVRFTFTMKELKLSTRPDREKQEAWRGA
jgi:hypothetical protein